MKKFYLAVSLGVAGAAAGAIIGEFFPRMVSSGYFHSLGNALSDPFSRYRNELALKCALFGIVIGAAVGFVLQYLKKK